LQPFTKCILMNDTVRQILFIVEKNK